MYIYGSNNRIILKAIAIALVCLFSVNTFSFASDLDTLAPTAGNPQVYNSIRVMMEEHLAEHQDPIDDVIYQNRNKAKSLSSIPHLKKEFKDCINACSANAMLTRLEATLIAAGGKIQVIFVKREKDLPIFEGRRAWGHAGTYITVFALEREKYSKKGRRKIIGRLFHEMRARSTRAKELFDEELKTQNPITSEEISLFLNSARNAFERSNLQIQSDIEQYGRITDPDLADEFANLIFAEHPDVINRDYMAVVKKQSSDDNLITIYSIIREVVEDLKAKDLINIEFDVKQSRSACLDIPEVVNDIKHRLKMLLNHLLSQLIEGEKISLTVAEDDISWYVRIKDYPGSAEKHGSVMFQAPIVDSDISPADATIIYQYPYVSGVQARTGPTGGLLEMPIPKHSLFAREVGDSVGHWGHKRLHFVPYDKPLPDLDIIFQNKIGISILVFIQSIEDIAYAWADGLEEGRMADVYIDEDSENVYVCVKDKAPCKEPDLKKRIAEFNPAEVMERYGFIVEIDKTEPVTMRIKMPKAHLKRIANEERRVAKGTGVLIEYLRGLEARLGTANKEQAVLKRFIPELCEALLSNEADLRARAIRVFEKAPS